MRSAKIKLELDRQIVRPQTPSASGWTNPVVPGDHPDPTIIRVGRTFWASATSGEWAPQFPLFRSTDLTHWQPSGAIFPLQPAWAEGSFWAPELVHDEITGHFFVWYVAKRRSGPLCIAVATARAPGGPYTDHGPLICQEDGSIDPCFARDEHGEPFLIWKEDGNSAGRPTPIWAQALSEDLLHLTGEKRQLITNDQPWEEGVVEGPYILRHLDHDGKMRFYMFYAGNSCCGKECKYAEGVARSEQLLGPWEKFDENPLIGANDNWRCPGHGTAVHATSSADQPARDYLLYHAYPAGGTIYVGREAVLDEITWPSGKPHGKAGWPSVNAGSGPGEFAPAPAIDFSDNFSGRFLGPSWQWPVNTHPDTRTGKPGFTLGIPLASPFSHQPVESAMVAVPRPASLHYRASVALVLTPTSASDSALWSGLAIVGDPFNTIGIGVRGAQITLWERRGATQRVIAHDSVPDATRLFLRATSFGEEHHLLFSCSTDGETYVTFGSPYDASDLPAWDRGLRIALLLEGPRGSSSTFQSFELRAQ